MAARARCLASQPRSNQRRVRKSESRRLDERLLRARIRAEARRDWFWRTRRIVATDVDSILRDFSAREAVLPRAPS